MKRVHAFGLTILLVFSLMSFRAQSQTGGNCAPIQAKFEIRPGNCGQIRFTCELLHGTAPQFQELIVNGKSYSTLDTSFRFIDEDRVPDTVSYSVRVFNDCSQFQDHGFILNDYHPFTAFANAQISRCSQAQFSFNINDLKYFPDQVVWDGEDGFHAENQFFPTHQYSQPGRYKYSLKVIERGGCDTSIYYGQVLIKNDLVVEAGPSQKMCIYDPAIRLNGIPYGGVWEGKGVENGVFYPSKAGFGVHQLTYTIKEGGCMSHASTSIEIPNPQTIILAEPNGNEVPVTVHFASITNQNSLQYFWDFGDPESGVDNYSTQPLPSHTYQNPGVYTAKLMVMDPQTGCFSRQDDFSSIAFSFNKKEIQTTAFRNRMNLNPNPGGQTLMVEIDKNENEVVNCDILNVEGKTIGHFITSSQKLEVDIHQYSPGVHIFRFTTEKGETFAGKFLVMH